MPSWYWHKSGESTRRGPVDEDELHRLVETGNLSRDDRVWKKGMEDWVPAYTISGLFDTPPPIEESHEKPKQGEEQRDRIQKDSTPSISKNMDEEGGSSEGISKDLKGVGGWMTFFCVIITVIGPLLTIGRISSNWNDAQPVFDQFPALKSATILENAVLAGIMIYGIVVGIMIWNGRPTGKVIAKRYLLIRLFAFISVETLVIIMLSDIPSSLFDVAVASGIKAIFAEGIFFTVWYLYFKKSKRVSATYG